MTANSFCAPCSPYPTAPALCFFCGEPEVVELFEIWGHEFMWETCCPSLHESLCQQVADDPPWGRELLRRMGVEVFTGHQLRRLADDGVGGLVLDWQLQARPITFKAACAFVRAHHAHCGPPVTARFSLSAWNGATLVGVLSRVVLSSRNNEAWQTFCHESLTVGFKRTGCGHLLQQNQPQGTQRYRA